MLCDQVSLAAVLDFVEAGFASSVDFNYNGHVLPAIEKSREGVAT